MKALLKSLFLSSALLAPLLVHAGVQVDRTRVIYPVGAREVAVELVNRGASPSLVQTWVDAGDAESRPKDIDGVPFVVTPPIARIDGGMGQSLRLSYVGNDAPTDRESLYWINILDIPAQQKSANEAMAGRIEANLQFSVRNRFKIFLRPRGLPGSADAAVQTVRWQAATHQGGASLRASNPSPYYVSVANLVIPGVGRVDASTVVPPMGQAYISLKSPLAAGTAFTVRTVNDYGGLVDTVVTLGASAPN
ncbi:molecular chaperone [Stenotrophomonas rhizophila]|uniref:fimbrial biogenesis chaperone n=1 Tax=Stenotrophomonas rhizophila TaxID=216778 RepID=UPI002A6AEEC6|nr:molecular chaperone [Stenotrophomonas rhizophila]MDY0954046.1 molecular chaperone [Stenotrophomonas rhizophila]